MDMEKYAKQLMEGKNGDALKKAVQSDAGARLAARFDGAAVEKAARDGDSEALSGLLKNILSTPEGRDFAAQVQKAVRDNGR